MRLLFFFLTAATLGVLMRLEMLTPGKTIVEPQTYNTFFTLHGIMMIFLFIIPGLPAVFGNFLMPIMIGAKDVFFPPPQPSLMVAFYHRWCDWHSFPSSCRAVRLIPGGRSTCRTAFALRPMLCRL